MSLLTSDIFLRALAVGLLIALAAGSLGTMVVIRRMSFFADAIAHASLTGIALGVLLQIDPLWAAIVFSLAVGLGIAWLARRNTLALDTIIGVFYSTAVALGVIIIGGLKGIRIDLESFLFGDILAVSRVDLVVAAVLVVVVLVVFGFILGPLVQLALNRDLARVQGVKVNLYEILFMSLMALMVAVGIKLVGIVLIGPLLIMPAAAAKNVSRSLLGMLVLSLILALVGVVAGMYGSVWLASPVGPTIVVAMAVLFGLSLALRPMRQR
ncbi:MAG: metal ABC transporter permease [Parcubacteria group bacterium]